ncbi:MAG: hypothetical protein P4L84_31305 [Isosphaeraceae bacterium]|nr:hypothetical protein [Isosphaeraceae bacterium]
MQTINGVSGYEAIAGTSFFYRKVDEAKYEILKDSNTMVLGNTHPNYFVPRIQANPNITLWDLGHADPNYQRGPIVCADPNSSSCLIANNYVAVPGTKFWYRAMGEAHYEIFKEYNSLVLGNTYPNYFVPKLQANPEMTLFDLSQADPNYEILALLSRDNDTPRNDNCMIIGGFMDRNGELNRHFADYVTNIKNAAEVKWMYGPRWYPTYRLEEAEAPHQPVKGWSLLIEIGGLDQERAAAENAMKKVGWNLSVQGLHNVGLGWTRTRQIYQYGISQRQKDYLKTGWDYMFPMFRGDIGANFVNDMRDHWLEAVISIIAETPGFVPKSK